ncbi:CLUMA_CG011360, isoform A [Clunio marinus]|uniref:CLUMA_CG011360, isoform A n=1 Tax=Clunio marinus TaxID=568069 RepID=A0A1J1ICI0_9DIPT|nr:CLUMA_CG011360, isoform A [Clunio marinus]
MAHGIKKILIDKNDDLECNNNQHNTNNTNKMALNSLLLDNCCVSSSNQTLMNQKNSSTTTNALVATHQLLPPTQSTTTLMNNSNKLSLNCGGASMSTIASSATKSPTTGTKMGSRRIFTPQFKLQVLESYRNDNDCKGNQRATARKYGIHRRQIQKWLQCENNLRSIIANNPQNTKNNAMKSIQKATAPILSSSSNSRHRGVVGANTDKNGGTYSCFTLSNAKSYKSNNVGSSTKSLTSSSLAFTDFSMGNNATAIEPTRNNGTINININNNFYYDNSRMGNINMYKQEELPIDLSCNNKIKTETVARPIAIHPTLPFYHFTPSPPSMSPPHLTDISNSIVKTELRNDPIDLTVPNVSHKRKLSTDNAEKAEKKPVKLFRPYLEGNFDESEKTQQNSDLQKFPLVWSNVYNFYPEHYNSDYNPANHPFLIGSPTYYDTHLTIPVTPSSTLSSPNDSGIINTSFQTLMPPSQASPVSGYDSSTSSIYSFNDNEADMSQSNSPSYSHYDPPSPVSATLSPTETKVPLFSSSFLHDLKFKLHTLDCYYNDAECKRSEKLVANKLNINCKVVEKWLRQESDLRHQQKHYQLEILV